MRRRSVTSGEFSHDDDRRRFFDPPRPPPPAAASHAAAPGVALHASASVRAAMTASSSLPNAYVSGSWSGSAAAPSPPLEAERDQRARDHHGLDAYFGGTIPYALILR
jgi:hypothetical protein